jgi:hypothetical protein
LFPLSEFLPAGTKEKKSKITKHETLAFKADLLTDPSIKWFFEHRVKQYLHEITICDNIEEEWQNLTHILKQAATESVDFKNKQERKKKV